MYILIPTCTYFEPDQPCPKLREPPVEEGVQEVDVDDHIDQVECMAEQIGESVPAQAESCHRYFTMQSLLGRNNLHLFVTVWQFWSKLTF